jgi:hypothetical protein
MGVESNRRRDWPMAAMIVGDLIVAAALADAG